MKKIVLLHLLTWVLLSATYFFLSEHLVEFLFPEIYDVELWLGTLFTGLILIFIGMTISLIINVVRHRRKLNASR